jgi:hypothetical protein
MEYLIKGPPVAEHEVNYVFNIAFYKVVEAFVIIQHVLKSIEATIVKRTLVSRGAKSNDLIIVGFKARGRHVFW